jgi:curved DNA-binding protein CbpA
MTEELRESYRLFDLEPGAPLDAVKTAYRELLKVWHPDRFPNQPKLQKKATESVSEKSGTYG